MPYDSISDDKCIFNGLYGIINWNSNSLSLYSRPDLQHFYNTRDLCSFFFKGSWTHSYSVLSFRYQITLTYVALQQQACSLTQFVDLRQCLKSMINSHCGSQVLPKTTCPAFYLKAVESSHTWSSMFTISVTIQYMYRVVS